MGGLHCLVYETWERHFEELHFRYLSVYQTVTRGSVPTPGVCAGHGEKECTACVKVLRTHSLVSSYRVLNAKSNVKIATSKYSNNRLTLGIGNKIPIRYRKLEHQLKNRMFIVHFFTQQKDILSTVFDYSKMFFPGGHYSTELRKNFWFFLVPSKSKRQQTAFIPFCQALPKFG